MSDLNESGQIEFSDGESSIDIYNPEQQFNTIQFLSELLENKLEPRLDIHNVINEIPKLKSETYFKERDPKVKKFLGETKIGFNRNFFKRSDVTSKYNEIIYRLRASNFGKDNSFSEALEVFQDNLKVQILDAIENVDLSQDPDLLEYLIQNNIYEKPNISNIEIILEKLEESFDIFKKFTGKSVSPMLPIYLTMFGLSDHVDTHRIICDWIDCILEIPDRMYEISQDVLDNIHVTTDDIVEEQILIQADGLNIDNSDDPTGNDEELVSIVDRVRKIKAIQRLNPVSDDFRKEIIFLEVVMKSMVRKEKFQLKEYKQEKKKREDEEAYILAKPFGEDESRAVEIKDGEYRLSIPYEQYNNLGLLKKILVNVSAAVITRIFPTEQ